MQSRIKTPSGFITRVVSDINHVMLCDGWQYGRISYNAVLTDVRRERDADGNGIGDWELAVDLGKITDINKQGLLDIAMSFARMILGEAATDEFCEGLILEEWQLLKPYKH